jgi:hypothetical protein
VSVVALWLPATASAHLRTGVVAVDSRASVFPVEEALRDAVGVRLSESDQAIQLSVRRRHEVVVLGYAGEPFLRLNAAGLEVNSASPTASVVGLLKPRRPSPPADGPRWRLQPGRRTAIWHDARVRALPASVARRVWSVPVVVDGRQARLAGEVWRVPAPSPWPWVAAGVAVVAATALVLRSRPPWARRAGIVLGVVCATLTVATAAAFALAPTASGGRWVEGANELAFAVFGLAVVAWGSADARPIAGGALGLLALWVGLTKTSVFAHGVVLSAFPDTPTRGLVLGALSFGAAATAAGLAVFVSIQRARRPRRPTEPVS